MKGGYRLAVLLSLLHGCAWMPESGKRAEMMTLPRLDKTVAESGVSSGRQWPKADWWRSFASPHLNQLMKTALQDNPGLKRVAARLRQSQAIVDVQAAELYPTVQAHIGFRAQRFSANSTQAKLAGEHFRQVLINPLVLRYHLDLWGRDEAALQGAVGEAMAAEIEQADARLLLSAAVAEAYFDLTYARHKQVLVKQIIAYREHLLRLEQVRLNTGLITTGPLLDAQRRLYRARQQALHLAAQIERDKHRLAALAGKGPDWEGGLDNHASLRFSEPTLPSDLPLHLLAHRPDVAALRLRVEAAAEQIKVAKTAFYPDVNLVSFAGLHSVSLSDVLLQGSSLAYAVGPSIEFPLFEGGRLSARLGYQEAAYDEVVERYNAQVLKAVQDVADALTAWREIDARLKEQNRNICAIDQTRRLAEVLFRQGLNDKLQVIQAQNAVLDEQIGLTNLQNSRLKAVTRLLTALGGGYVRNINE